MQRKPTLDLEPRVRHQRDDEDQIAILVPARLVSVARQGDFVSRRGARRNLNNEIHSFLYQSSPVAMSTLRLGYLASAIAMGARCVDGMLVLAMLVQEEVMP